MKNSYRTEGQVTHIVCSGGELIIDTDDLEKVLEYSKGSGWFIDQAGYGVLSRDGVRLHRLIMGIHGVDWLKTGVCIDHINIQPADCRKENLRIVTAQENNSNRSTEDGKAVCAYYREKTGEWESRLSWKKKIITLGGYPTKEMAQGVYDFASEYLRGEICTNHAVLGVEPFMPHPYIMKKLEKLRDGDIETTFEIRKQEDGKYSIFIKRGKVEMDYPDVNTWEDAEEIIEKLRIGMAERAGWVENSKPRTRKSLKRCF